MATMMSIALSSTTITNPSAPLPYSWNRLPTTAQRSLTSRSLTKRSAHTSCQQKNGSSDDAEPILRMDRRNVLLGLGGLYSVAGLGYDKAMGSPVVVDLPSCHDATVPDGVTGPLKCCPPFKSGQKAKEFKLPSQSLPMRVRKPAHEFNGDDLAKYKEAIRIMKEDLSPDDPWHWMQQANIHCAYCHNAYDQLGQSGIPVSVHGSWIFLPWHRMYLYFFEKILGKIIGDETLAIPFWNWDAPDGMSMPSIFTDPTSPLFDENRNPANLDPTALIDLAPSQAGDDVVQKNLLYMATVFDNNLRPASLFMGDPLSAGAAQSKAGVCESLHFPAHIWAGAPTTPRMDMGNLFSAARDPLFYSHHSNTDRMWHLYRMFRGHHQEFKSNDWLDAAFYFYDENRELVTVKVSDALNANKLGFTYEEVPLPWREGRTRIKKSMVPKKRSAAAPFSMTPINEFGAVPRALTNTIRAIVPRPKTSRTKAEKEDEMEILIIDGIEDANDEPVAFDIFVSVPLGDAAAPDLGELAGCFQRLPHGNHGSSSDVAGPAKSVYKLGLTSLLDDFDADNAEKLVVSFVPHSGTVSIGGARIELVKCDD